MIFFQLNLACIYFWGKNASHRSRAILSQLLFIGCLCFSLATTAFMYICVIEWMSGGEGRTTSNIIPSLSSCFQCSPTLARNGSEGIVCLWFSFERVWSFFSWRLKNSLDAVEERKNCLVRGNARKPARTFIPKRCVLRQTTCLFVSRSVSSRFCHSTFGFPIFFVHNIPKTHQNRL